MNHLKIGDLVCYNAAGQKFKTLGVVMDFDFASKVQNRSPHSVLIMWSVVGEVMPRQDWHRKQYTLDGRGIRSGDMIWHEFGDWIEVVNENS
jgi:hypothetical protein